MTTFTLRFDEETKSRLDNLCDSLGMNLTTFFMIYVKKSIKEQRIPFELSNDPFYTKRNLEEIEEALEEIRRGETVEPDLDALRRRAETACKVRKKS